MKRYILLLLMLGCGLIARAQIIQGATVTVENAARNATTRGYKGYIEAGVGVNVMAPSFAFEFTTTHGYQFQHLYLGIGTGVTSNAEYNTDRFYALPIFGEARWLFNSRSEWGAYAGIKIGYDIHLGEACWTTSSTEYQHNTYHQLKGLYLSPGFGVEYRHLTLSINYLIRGVKERYNTKYQQNDVWNHTTNDYGNSTLLLRIGVNF